MGRRPNGLNRPRGRPPSKHSFVIHDMAREEKTHRRKRTKKHKQVPFPEKTLMKKLDGDNELQLVIDKKPNLIPPHDWLQDPNFELPEPEETNQPGVSNRRPSQLRPTPAPDYFPTEEIGVETEPVKAKKRNYTLQESNNARKKAHYTS
jgi:hypothetical protein